MIKLNEKTNLEFNLSVRNTTGVLERATMFIEENGYDISIPIRMDGDNAKLSFPIMENMVTPGIKNVRIEVLIDGVLYTPYRDKMEFSSPPSITVESVKQSINPAINIQIGNMVEDSEVGNRVEHRISDKFTQLLADSLSSRN